jgi:hypothetical protein
MSEIRLHCKTDVALTSRRAAALTSRPSLSRLPSGTPEAFEEMRDGVDHAPRS